VVRRKENQSVRKPEGARPIVLCHVFWKRNGRNGGRISPSNGEVVGGLMRGPGTPLTSSGGKKTSKTPRLNTGSSTVIVFRKPSGLKRRDGWGL